MQSERNVSHVSIRKRNQYQKTYTFDNGYGASVICNQSSYGNTDGLFELAVLDKNGDICYDTPITSDVIGYMTHDHVARVLKDIESLA
jgi:hypothetical protein